MLMNKIEIKKKGFRMKLEETQDGGAKMTFRPMGACSDNVAVIPPGALSAASEAFDIAGIALKVWAVAVAVAVEKEKKEKG